MPDKCPICMAEASHIEEVVEAGAQPAAKPVDGLMVGAVDGKAFAVQMQQKRVVCACFVQAVPAADPAVSVDVLVQRAAEENIDELQTAADAEHRFAACGEKPDERKLTRIAAFVDVGGAGKHLTVEARMKVAAAGQQQRVGAHRIGRGGESRDAQCGEVVWERQRKINRFHITEYEREVQKVLASAKKMWHNKKPANASAAVSKWS